MYILRIKNQKKKKKTTNSLIDIFRIDKRTVDLYWKIFPMRVERLRFEANTYLPILVPWEVGASISDEGLID